VLISKCILAKLKSSLATKFARKMTIGVKFKKRIIPIRGNEKIKAGKWTSNPREWIAYWYRYTLSMSLDSLQSPKVVEYFDESWYHILIDNAWSLIMLIKKLVIGCQNSNLACKILFNGSDLLLKWGNYHNSEYGYRTWCICI
jgi:hypothetical protein